MPYILLVLGLLIGGYALYRFISRAAPAQIRALGLTVLLLAVGTGTLLLALTGRLPAAIAVLVALWPLALMWLKSRTSPAADAAVPPAPADHPMTAEEALDVLGLPSGADQEAVNAAHKRLIKKVHPDQEGSTWLAERINTARDILLKNHADSR